MKWLIILALCFSLTGCSMTPEQEALREDGKRIGKEIIVSVEFVKKAESDIRGYIELYKSGEITVEKLGELLPELYATVNEGNLQIKILKGEAELIAKKLKDMKGSGWAKFWAVLSIILGIGGTLATKGYLGKANAVFQLVDSIEHRVSGEKRSKSATLTDIKELIASFENPNINKVVREIDPK